MGYCIQLVDVDFTIKADRKAEAFALFAAVRGGWHWTWTEDRTLDAATTIEDVLNEFRYEPEVDEHGDITYLRFTGEKIGDEDQFFTVIAPAVEDGYLEFVGEDHERWRFVFKGGVMHTLEPTTTWS